MLLHCIHQQMPFHLGAQNEHRWENAALADLQTHEKYTLNFECHWIIVELSFIIHQSLVNIIVSQTTQNRLKLIVVVCHQNEKLELKIVKSVGGTCKRMFRDSWWRWASTVYKHQGEFADLSSSEHMFGLYTLKKLIKLSASVGKRVLHWTGWVNGWMDGSVILRKWCGYIFILARESYKDE